MFTESGPGPALPLLRPRASTSTAATWSLMLGLAAVCVTVGAFTITGCRGAPRGGGELVGYPHRLPESDLGHDWEDYQAPPDGCPPHPFLAGEELRFRLYLAGFNAGTAVLRVREGESAIPGSELLLEGEMRGAGILNSIYPIRMQAGARVNTLLLQPFSYHQSSLSGSRHNSISIRFNPDTPTRLQVERRTGSDTVNRRVKTVPGAVDQITALFIARAALSGSTHLALEDQEQWRRFAEGDAPPGDEEGTEQDNGSPQASERDDEGEEDASAPPFDTLYIPITDGRRTRLMTLEWGGREEVVISGTRLDTIRLRGSSVLIDLTDEEAPELGGKPTPFSIWVADDDLLLPVRIQGSTSLGSGEAELERVTVGDQYWQCRGGAVDPSRQFQAAESDSDLDDDQPDQ